jgi:hypothetical protein
MDLLYDYIEQNGAEVIPSQFYVGENDDDSKTVAEAIVYWNYPFPKPTRQMLDAVDTGTEKAKSRQLQQLRKSGLMILNTNQSNQLKPKMKQGMIWFNKTVDKVQYYDGKDVMTL